MRPADDAPFDSTPSAETAADAAHLAAAHAPSEDRQWLLQQLGRLEFVLLRRAAFVQVLVLVAHAGGVAGIARQAQLLSARDPLS